jgi:hypothetical protein
MHDCDYIWSNRYVVLKQGGGGAPPRGFGWGGALDEEELVGDSPRSSWVLRGRRLGLAAVGGSSV